MPPQHWPPCSCGTRSESSLFDQLEGPRTRLGQLRASSLDGHRFEIAAPDRSPGAARAHDHLGPRALPWTVAAHLGDGHQNPRLPSMA